MKKALLVSTGQECRVIQVVDGGALVMDDDLQTYFLVTNAAGMVEDKRYEFTVVRG